MHDFILTLMLLGAMSSVPVMPFWATANRFGIMPEADGGVAYISASGINDLSNTVQWSWGASLAAGMDTYFAPGKDINGGEPISFEPEARIMMDQLYGSLHWKMFSLDLGMKHREQGFLAGNALQGPAFLGSLSTTGGNILWSGNSRSIPGYSLKLEPVPVPFTGGRVEFSASYGDYRTLDNRYVKGALLHNTRFGLTIHITDRFDFLGRLDHYALWSGTHPERGKRPSGLKNYIRVVTGAHGSSDATTSDQINVLGDQRGEELYGLRWKGDNFSITFQHDIPYDDGSGMGFQNFPDGVNTLHFGLKDKTNWVSDVLLEYATTMWQSGTRHDWIDSEGRKHTTGGGDNYFNNSEYRSGWTLYGRTIGYPLFYPQGTRYGGWDPYHDPFDEVPSSPVLGIENNRLKAMHLGLAGMLFKKAPYKLMLTYSQNYGIYMLPYKGESQWEKDPGTVKETPLSQFSGAFMGEVPFKRLAVLYGLYADKGEVLTAGTLKPTSIFGATLGVRWSLEASPSRL